MSHKCKYVRRLILHQKQCLYENFFENFQRFGDISDLILGDIFFFLWSPCIGDQKDQYFFRDIFFFLCSPCMGMQKYQWGTHFFFCEVIVWDIFFKSIFCKSASRTLRSLRSLRATAGRGVRFVGIT